jgi:SnoaL-like polyketide cyclase
MSAEENLRRMKTLDDAWNAQNWEVFRKRHSADTKVYWPGQPDPTVGRDAHHRESEAFFKSIENHLENNPYRVMLDPAIGPAQSPNGKEG